MVYELIEQVFNRGMLTRKVINDIQHKTLEWVGLHKQTFDFYRERVEEFAAAKRKAHRGEIIVALSTIGYNGIFSADEIAEILLNTDNREVVRVRALAKLDEIEGKYNENNRKAAILRKGISQVIPKKWTYKMSVSASNVSVRFYPPVRNQWGNVLADGAEEIYAFIQMICMVRPMLRSVHRKFDFDTFQTIANVWGMGCITYCYSYPLDTTGATVLEAERKLPYHDNYASYDLPDHIKATILDMVRQNIATINVGLYYSPEDGSYNSVAWKPIPDKGLWVTAGKTV